MYGHCSKYKYRRLKNKTETDLANFKNLIKRIKNAKNSLIILESTLPPGFCDKVVLPILKTRKDLSIAFSYERVMPGANYLKSLIYNHRVYAGHTLKAEKKCRNFLTSIIDTKKYPLTKLNKIISAETAKIIENTYRAVNVLMTNGQNLQKLQK